MKNNNDDAKKSRPARGRANGKGVYSGFEWDSVDNQEQDDLIEPIESNSTKKSARAKKRVKQVGTMFVSSEDEDIYAPVKKKKVPKTPRAEDFAGFVAEVEEDEVDPYAVPSYGQTRLTHEDEELVEELAIPKERKPRERKNNNNNNRRDKREEEDSQETPAAPGKRSFLSKIKEAISTGAVARGDAQDGAPSGKSIKRLEDKVARAAKGANVPFESRAESQIDALVRCVEALVAMNASLQARIDALEKGGAILPTAVPVAPKAEKATKVESKPAPEPKRERRDAKPAASREVRKSLLPDDDFDDYDDPIARWENMPDDDYELETTTAKSDAKTDGDDFEEWDEVASKKKSARFQENEEGRSLFEEATPVASEPRKKRARAKKESADAEPREEKRKSDKGEKLESKTLERFGDLKLKKATLKALTHMGYVEPTPIQSGTIPRIQEGVDLMGQAKTGTGKTAAFMIPIVEGVSECEPCDAAPLALIVAPTRELAVQARDETERIAKFYDMNVVACYGGKPIASQVEKIRKGVDILFGTPGRVIDLCNRGALSLSKARWVVLDEADRMLDVGFRPDVERILRMTPKTRQTLLFSATLPPPVMRLAKTYMKEPEQYDFSLKNVSADTIEQFYLTVDQSRKFDALVRLLEVQNPRQAIVFCRTKRCVDMVARRLTAKLPNVEAIHGDLPQTKRDRIMREFRAEKTKILVATDVVGRGIDVSTVSHIVNYDVPQYCDDYVHRVGRAGRMGREGVAFTLVTAEEGAELTRIEIRINKLLERYEIPDFEAYSKPVESAEEVERERKPVFGQTVRRARRAL